MSLADKIKEKEQERNKEYDILFWKPVEGDVLMGTVEEMGSTITEHGDSEYIQIQTDEQKKFMVFLNSVLQKLVEQEDVKTGDRIAIKFLGLVQSRKFKTKKYKDYILVKDDE
jgi:hypothetical protein